MNSRSNSQMPAFFEELAVSRDNEKSSGKISRRHFFKLSGVAGGGLTLGLAIGSSQGLAQTEMADVAEDAILTPFVQIQSDGRINIFSKNPECGQGIKTGLPMIIAEELDARWEDVNVRQADIDASRYGLQLAGGSFSTPMNWMAMREAGATARLMILTAAAEQLYVPITELSTRDSMVIHEASGESYPYSEFAELAATLAVPDAQSLTLKDPADFTLLGRRVGGVDNEAIVRGGSLFGIDQRQADMVYASYTKSPAMGGLAVSFNESHIKALPGVIDAFILEPVGELIGSTVFDATMLGGVAIIADSTWTAMKAKQQLEVVWDESTADTAATWSTLAENAAGMAQQDGEMELLNRGDTAAAFTQAEQVVEAFYEYPYVSHVNLEPQNCTALYSNGRLDIWAPSQTPQVGEAGAAAVTGIGEENTFLHQTRIGGGFGRRLNNDFVIEVAMIARRMEGRPVKLQWTREDDMVNDFYRPGGFHALRASLDAEGRMTGFSDHFISEQKNAEAGRPIEAADLTPNILPMEHLPNVRITQTLQSAAIPTGFMRAPGSNAFAFTFQSFLHEVAEAGNRDYRDFLLELLDAPDQEVPEPAADAQQGLPAPMPFINSRARNVIFTVADRAEWGRPMPEGRALGLAFYYSHSGYVAQVADVSVNDDREVTVHKVWSVADFGLIHNRSAAENQIQGSIIDGLSQLMYAKITFDKGVIQQNNFHQYPLLRISRAPQVDVHFLEPADVAPTGAGEPALPPALPAIANAIYSASGERVRKLPLSEAGFKLV